MVQWGRAGKTVGAQRDAVALEQGQGETSYRRVRHGEWQVAAVEEIDEAIRTQPAGEM